MTNGSLRSDPRRTKLKLRAERAWEAGVSDIFVNYRSLDAQFGAAAIYELLANRFDRDRIFLDNHSIEPGAEYPDRIRAALEAMRVLLVLIGPRWLAPDPGSPDRLLIDNERDWVRVEIGRGFERHVQVVPILLEGSRLPEPDMLPETVRPLVHCQAVEVSHHRLGEDVNHLADWLAGMVPGLDRIGTAGRPGRVPVPRQLPPAPPWFVGRGREFAELTGALDGVGPLRGARIATISGVGGIGKTWLALHWAHRHADRFPDGQLFVDLRGASPTGRPMDLSTAIRCLLDALGGDPRTLPVDVDAQVGRYRSLVAGRRMLIILDNAESAAQVTPLLPGSPTCAVLITSRDRMDGLLTSAGAHRLVLDPLTDAQAHDLLVTRLHAHRTAAEPAATADLIRYCAGLPLALAIVASRMVGDDSLPLAVPAAELQDTATRLGAFDSGDPGTSVTTVLSWSYDTLPAPDSRLFGLVGLASGPDIGLPTIASLAGCPVHAARTDMRALERMSLVHQHSPGRWQLHNLVRLYAAERAEQALPVDDRTAALRRMTDYYVHAAHAADRLLNGYREPLDVGVPVAGVVPERFDTRPAALEWFTAEQRCVHAAQQFAAEQGWSLAVWRLAWVQHSFLWQQGRVRDQVAAWQAALDASTSLGDPAKRALAHRLLGSASARTGDVDAALRHLEVALTLTARTGDRRDHASVHRALARVWGQRADDERALVHATEALRGYRALHNPSDEADALDLVCWCYAKLGRYEPATAHGEAALALYRDLGDQGGEATALDSLGYTAHRAGRYALALDYYRRALALFLGGNTYHEANTLERVGDAYAGLSRPTDARAAWRQSLRLYRQQDRTADVRRVRRRLGATRQRTARPNQERS
jgi:tetratricopeptide (TPR) repeat protein